jgi:hypothetical protein
VLTAGAGNSTNNNSVLATVGQVAFAKRISFAPKTDSDQPGVLPETTIMQTALTFDEGGNFINVNFSPLTPWDLSAATFGSLRADYHINAGSVAINAGANRTTGTNGNRVPTKDYDDQSRPANSIDVGADEIAGPAPTVSGISPNLGISPTAGSNSYQVTLTGTNLTGAALTESSGNFNVSSVVVVNSTTITATIEVQFGATSGAKTLTVTALGQTATVDFTVVPAAPVSFTSEAGPANLTGSGTTLSFGNLSGAQPDTVTVTVGGTAAVTFGTATVANGTGTAFLKGADSCSSTTRNPGETCTITVNFNAPTTNNSNRTGTLSVPYSGATGSPVNLALTGS